MMLYKRFFDAIGEGAQLRIAILQGYVLRKAQKLVECIRLEIYVGILSGDRPDCLGLDVHPVSIRNSRQFRMVSSDDQTSVTQATSSDNGG